MHCFKYIAATIVMTILFASSVACSTSGKITSVSAAVFGKGIENPRVQIVDVRTPDEYNSGHIAGAINIDVNSTDFITQATETLKDDIPVYVYCRSGKRSKIAAEQLVKKGYKVVDLDSGIIDWQSNGFPVTDPAE